MDRPASASLQTHSVSVAYYSIALVMFGDRHSCSTVLADDSRTGRAWRALREDPLAAEAMAIRSTG